MLQQHGIRENEKRMIDEDHAHESCYASLHVCSVWNRVTREMRVNFHEPQQRAPVRMSYNMHLSAVPHGLLPTEPRGRQQA